MSARARTPTDEVRADRIELTGPGAGRPAVEQATPTLIDAPPSEPIRVISMKDASGPRPVEDPRPLHVQLRSIAEMSRRRDTPAHGLGHLAPPRDPREVRARRMRGNLVWAAVALAMAGAIALATWLVAG